MAHNSNNGYKRKRLETESDEVIILDEWGDEFNDQLEEVCAIAESTQIPVETSTSHNKSYIPNCSKIPETPKRVGVSKDNEKKKLIEDLKTKEGEVAILRAKLKNAEMQQSRREAEIVEKQKTEVENLKKTVKDLQGELEFKNLEVNDLASTVKTLELRSPKIRFIERTTLPLNSEQTTSHHIAKTSDESDLDDFEIEVPSLGNKFSKLVVPGFFKRLEEKSVVLMYDASPLSPGGLEHLRHDKFKWAGLPQLPQKLHSIYPYVTELMRNEAGYFRACLKILEISKEIITSLREVLNYLKGIQIDMAREEALVADTSNREPLSMKDLLTDRLMTAEERGIETRRSLAICACVVSVYREALVEYSSKNVLELLRDVVKLIGKIMRPVEFSGVLAAVLIYLQALLRDKDETRNISEESILLIKSIIEDVIFCRPKLDVLTQVIGAYSAGTHYKTFHSLCHKSPPDSCALYMDSRLRQAIFFNAEACPLKLLQVQIKTLAHFSTNREALFDICNKFIFWYQCIVKHSNETPTWLLRDTDECCDVTECLSHLLVLVLINNKRNVLLCKNVIEKGIMVLKEATKRGQKKVRCDTLKLLPLTIRTSNILEFLAPKPKEYAMWIISEYDSQLMSNGSFVWSKGSGSDS